MEIFITIAVVIMLWVVIVWGGFHVLSLFKIMKSSTASAIVRFLYLIYIALAGIFFLFLSPLAIRPSFGDIIFIIVSTAAGLLIIIFGISAVRAIANKQD